MATTAEREQLLATACPWCSARPGEECHNGTKARRPLRSLDGGCHDARWRRALGIEAQVTMPERPAYTGPVKAEQPEREPVSVGAAMPVMERPW